MISESPSSLFYTALLLLNDERNRFGAWDKLHTDPIQEAKYIERWPNTTSAWVGWSRFDIPVDRYGRVHSLLICTSITLVSPTCHQASQQENTYWTKYQKADRARTLVTLWIQRGVSVHPTLPTTVPWRIPPAQTVQNSITYLSDFTVLV
jgi:hypothetical protein